MKNFYFFALIFLFPCAVFSQIPSNDDCNGIINFGFAPSCPTETFTNVNATPSNIGFDNNPTCFNGNLPSRDVWFQFTCPDTLFDFRITLTGTGANPIENPQFAVYRGDCAFDGLAELYCRRADVGDNSLFLDMAGLTPGADYFIRVSDYSVNASPNWGEFNLCVDKIPPISTIDQGGSTLCEGTLYDSGGPDGDYSPNEGHSFTICPPVPTGCIEFTLEYYNFDYGGSFLGNGNDALSFYDGPNTDAPLLTQINGQGFSPEIVSGGGGVCFRVKATSGCLTIAFQSDDIVEFEGFKGHWSCSNEPCEELTNAITLSEDANATDIEDAVKTPFTTVNVTDINCSQNAYGTFTHSTDNTELGLKQGLVLTTGSLDYVYGPNVNGSDGDDLFGEGDADLDYLSLQQGNGEESMDACIVEMDVFVATNELSFEYVFGSEEYPEYANNLFNDIFAFLVSGPGIVGDPNLTNNAKNIAIIPGTTDPVQINSINNVVNWEYYRNNELGQSIGYDGLTSDYLGVKKSLTARTPVVPCNTYHLKLAIADRSDGVFDSGVFVSEIKGANPNLSVNFASGIDYFVESCSGSEDQLIISLNEAQVEAVSFNTVITGTAILGVDYTMNLPPVITFPAGTTSLSFPMIPINDALAEGNETVIITLTNNFGCGTVVYKSLTIDIKDNVEVDINAGADTVYVCTGGTFQLDAQGAVNFFWTPPGAVSNPFIGNPTITPTQNIWLEVTGTLANCVDKDSVYVRIIAPVMDAVALSPTNICKGTSVQLQVTDNVNHQGLTWTPSAGIDNVNSASATATPDSTTTYFAVITIAGCTIKDSLTIRVDTLFFPTILTTDTTVCQNYSVQLAENTDSSSTVYVWSPAQGLDNANTSSAIATPDNTTTYTLTATSANGYCSQTADVKITIIKADIDIEGDVYREICLGDTLKTQFAINPPNGSAVQWSPQFALNVSGNAVKAFPDETTTFVATYTVNNCTVRDSVRLRVDSLPLNTIRRQPDKAVYCPGDTIYLISKTYEPASFPDIAFDWLPFPEQLTEKENWNMVILASTTHTYQRVETNHACRDTGEVLVNVSIPPTITITAADPILCPGQSTQLLATVTPTGTELEWDENPALSCTKCTNPTVNPQITTTFTIKTTDAPCPSQADIVIPIGTFPQMNTPVNPVICPGASVLLNNVNDPTSTYNWTTLPPSGFTSNQANPSTSPAQNTTYVVEAASADGCIRTAQVNVSIAQGNIDAGQDAKTCKDAPVTLNATVTGSGSVTWQPGNGSGSSFSPPTSTAGTQTYIATLVYNDNCIKQDSVKVNVIQGVQFDKLVSIPAGDSTICEGTPLTITATFIPPTNLTLAWTAVSNGTEQPYTKETTATIKPVPDIREGNVSYFVTATDANGCMAISDVAEFELKKCTELPNAFTPGNDEINEGFGLILQGGQVTIEKFVVYSRWGQKVFEATNTSKVWDGTVDGKIAPSDVYNYIMVLKYANGTTETKHGDVTLIR